MVGVALIFDKLIAKSADAGSRIHDKDIVAVGSYFKARGIPAVPQIFATGNRNGSSGSPHLDLHHDPFWGRALYPLASPQLGRQATSCLNLSSVA
jgi:hypothetical protein